MRQPRILLLRALPLSIVLLMGLMGRAHAQGCTTCVPLDDLSGPVYRGRAPGLYAAGLNVPPPAHAALALSQAALVVPRDAAGAASANGRIGFLAIGMSNANQEFSAFERLEDARIGRNPRVVVVGCAFGGQSADVIVNPAAPYWTTVSQRVSAAGLSAAQVQVLWLKDAEGAMPDSSFPAHADTLRSHLRSIVRALRGRYPNLRLAYLSSRTYGGWNSAVNVGEPVSYETAFAVRDLIAEQTSGSAALNADPAAGAVQAPVLLWGPYLWARGNTPRASDGLTWPIAFVETDHVHPSMPGEARVAQLLADFLLHESTAAAWRDRSPGETSMALDAVADAWVDDLQPTVNHGTDTTLAWVNASARSYIRFDLSSVTAPVFHAKLSLRNLPDPTTSAVQVARSSNTVWTETGITAASAPAFDLGTVGTIPQASRGTAISLDVTAAVVAALASGPGAGLTLGLRATSGPVVTQFVRARETGEGPRLVLSLAGGTVGVGSGAVTAVPRLRAQGSPFGRDLPLWLESPMTARVELLIFDPQGRRVRRLLDEVMPSGAHRLVWDALDDAGRPVVPGLYLARAVLQPEQGRTQYAVAKLIRLAP